ncbi:DUF6489 family protein [Sphingomonas sp.]|jgi:hypothetical protein|uniref:DUF6489 family protein n=1 Tax=Sphingomonas sp. TaxID=28214 RepID=UPI0035C79806
MLGRTARPLKGNGLMKVNVELDCTPEEMRRLFGLPDLAPLHERYMNALGSSMEGGIKPETVEALVKNWAPMGEAGMQLWRRMMEANKPK